MTPSTGERCGEGNSLDRFVLPKRDPQRPSEAILKANNEEFVNFRLS